MAEKTLDEQIAEVNSQITDALRDPTTTPQKRKRLGEEMSRLNTRKMLGGQ